MPSTTLQATSPDRAALTRNQGGTNEFWAEYTLKDVGQPDPERTIPSPASVLWFRFRVTCLQAKRGLTNLARPVPRLSQTTHKLAHLRSVSTPLRTSDHPNEQGLQLGKIENLRRVARLLDGLEIRAGREFSFWRQVGRLTLRRGFVDGREIREGCIVPAIGGGICQLTNALHELAHATGCTITERHPHTRAVPGVAATGRDATVAWNHIDLRFRPDQDTILRVRLTDHELVVGFETASQTEAQPRKPALRILDNDTGSCETCGQMGCSTHNAAPAQRARATQETTAFVLDGVTPEFAARLRGVARAGDAVLLPMRGRSYAWPEIASVRVLGAPVSALIRGAQARIRREPPEQRARLIADTDRIADALGEQIPYTAGRLICDINFLPRLAANHRLGGREVEVWLSRFPFRLLHQLLDEAAQVQPESVRLSDFRAPESLVDQEWDALSQATRLVTAHPWLAAELERHFPSKVVLLGWVDPTPVTITRGDYLYFPGPTAAREGAVAVREAALRLGLPVSVGGQNLDSPDFWGKCTILSAETHPMRGSLCVVHPAVLKNRPSLMLAAVASGKPVITTGPCGVPGALTVPFGDVDALVERIRALQ